MASQITAPPEGLELPGDDSPVGPPPTRLRDLALWCWRQLTSMRVALVLLLLLALAAVPGSTFPQRRTDPIGVAAYLREHPTLGPWLDRFSLFDVFGSPWFGAVYVLLMISLVGCIVPRAIAHGRALRARPPAAPRNLERMRDHRAVNAGRSPDQVLTQAAAELRRRHYRVDVSGDAVSAERGYLRETGNLVFHLALLVVLVGAAAGGLFGMRGSVVLTEGETFTNTATRYDDLAPGRFTELADPPPFTITLDDFEATFATDEDRRGQADEFVAHVTYAAAAGGALEARDIRVNAPLSIDGTDVHLMSNGYAPVFTVRDGAGDVAYSGPVVFLPQDQNFTSTGVIKVPDAEPVQLGFTGFFLPTAVIDDEGPHSVFPSPVNPAVVLLAWHGDLGLDSGVPQSVYQLDTDDMERFVNEDGDPLTELLGEGETLELPDGGGSITYDGYVEWAQFEVSSNPGLPVLLLGTVVALLGLMLSLFVPRRRLWVRALPDGSGGSLVALAALDRAHGGGLDEELDEVAGALTDPREAVLP